MTSSGPPPPPEDSVALVVLAGGRGRRLGGVLKPLLTGATGETILEIIARTFRAELGSRGFVVAPPDILVQVAARTPFEPVADRGLGPAAALVEVARAASVSWLFVVGADQPRPSSALLRRMKDCAGAPSPGVSAPAASGSIDAVRVARDPLSRELEPFPGLYRRCALVRVPVVDREGVGPSLRALLDPLSTRVLPWAELSVDEQDAFLDIDTPEDRERLKF